MNSKILFIFYYYPPLHSIAVKRNYTISTLTGAYFSKSLVLSSSNSIALQSDKNLLHIKANYIINSFDYRNWLSMFSRKKSIHLNENVKNNIFSQFFIKLINSFPFNVLIGEGGITYIIRAYKKSRDIIKEEGITHIYTSFRPFADHFIGYLLKIKFKTQLHWTADFRDLHVDPIYNNVLFPRLQHYFNTQIFKKADLLTTVSEGLSLHLKQYNSQVFVVRNGISALKTLPTSSNDLFTITYTGSLFTIERDPSLVFEAIRNLISQHKIDPSKIKIIYAGKDGTLWNQYIDKYQLTDINQNMGMINSKASQTIQNQSNINLLLTSAANGLTGVITGKFYEYLEAQKPILVSIKGSKDEELAQILNDFKAGIIANSEDPNAITQIENWLLLQYEKFIENESTIFNIDIDKIKPYYWENISESLTNRIFEKA